MHRLPGMFAPHRDGAERFSAASRCYNGSRERQDWQNEDKASVDTLTVLYSTVETLAVEFLAHLDTARKFVFALLLTMLLDRVLLLASVSILWYYPRS